ncbi:MAG: tetratricopeptide repeat protein [Alphaproteobacteria bacterium]|nr:tetratricopeptide repeat protein [Alphaproteobacteria bacterium]
MKASVLRRFVILGAAFTFVAFSGWVIVQHFTAAAPGDFHVREGDIRLGDRKYDEAIAAFDRALTEMPDHRGALMGRAIALMQMGKTPEALAEFTYLIDTLGKALAADDPTGRATLAAAYANRGIMHDRAGRYETALADYVEALKTDAGALDGPSLFDKILYGTPRPSTVLKRAQYLEQQLKLPPEERLLRVPEIDAEQRMYKP